MEKVYERNMHHNYMILSSYDFFGEKEEDYTEKMLLSNTIPGLLPVLCRKDAGKTQYCYEINSLQSLERLFEKREMDYEVLRKLLLGCIRIFERLEEYLLDGSQLLLTPEYIYLHMDTKEPFFVCYPEYHGDIRSSFAELMHYLLTKIDHTQKKAVWLSYQVYRYTGNVNYVIGEIQELLFEAENMQSETKEETICYQENLSEKETMQYEMVQTEKSGKQEKRSYIDLEVCEDEKENKKKDKKKDNKKRNICIFLALSTGCMVLACRVLQVTPLSQKQEISLCGVIGMSVVAAMIFFMSFVKQCKKEKAIAPIKEQEADVVYEKTVSPAFVQPCEKKTLHTDSILGQTSQLFGETMVLGQDFTKERFLQGRVNGEEVRVPLKSFPMTLGKLAGFSDFVIQDNTVSRMHARLEEKNGQIFISDLNSTNGTIRNGNMLSINEEVALEPGDQIMLGRVCFTYC